MPRKPLQSRVEYAAFRASYAVLRLLPFRFSAWLLSELTLFAGMVLGLRRKLVAQNMRLTFPQWTPAQLRREMRMHYRHVGRTIAETYLDRENRLLGKIRVEGMEHLEQAMRMERGVVMLSAHMGNWEIGGRYLVKQGLPIYAVIKKQRNPWFDRFTSHLRQSAGIHEINPGRSLKEILRTLRAKGIVVILADQYAAMHGVQMDFLGRPAAVHTGPARIAAMSGAPLVCIFGMRKRDGTHILSIEEPILPPAREDGDAGIDRMVRRYTDRMEERIRACPSQWLWMHNRWKHPSRARPLATREDV